MGVIGLLPDIVLDRMSMDEVLAAMKAKDEIHKTKWEQTRLMCFYGVIAQQGTKDYKAPEDLFTLDWDEKQEKKVKGKPLTQEQAAAKYRNSKAKRKKQR